MEVNMDKNTASKTKIVSIVISSGIIATLIIGVISVVRSVNSNRNNENNIVNLNETQENVAIKTEDVTDDILGNIDDELQEANAGASMAADTDNISNKADNTYNTHKAGTDDADKETEPTVPPTLSSEEVMAEAKKNILTPDGLKALEDELQELKVVRRKEIAQKIKEAREQGDLSENAEYDAAKDEQRDMEARIEEIEKILQNAVVIDEKFEKGVISLGCRVLLEDITLGKEVTYHIVGSTEADILQNKISNEAPIGRALLGKKIGDVVSVEGINQVNDFRVIDVQRK